MTDAELIEIAADFREGIIGGIGQGSSSMMCAAVSWPLAGLLSFYGVECITSQSDVETANGVCNHIWIMLSDGRVLDPTADQFNTPERQYPAVYLGPPIDLHIRNG